MRKESHVEIKERLTKATTKFFRKGKSGSWKDEMTPSQVQQVIAAHGEIMQRFAYNPVV